MANQKSRAGRWIGLVVIGCGALSLGLRNAKQRDSRISGIVALVNQGRAIKPFMARPGTSFIQASARRLLPLDAEGTLRQRAGHPLG